MLLTGSGRSSTVLTALKMALFDPIATAKVRTVGHGEAGSLAQVTNGVTNVGEK